MSELVECPCCGETFNINKNIDNTINNLEIQKLLSKLNIELAVEEVKYYEEHGKDNNTK